jgi:hypothetical protein
MGGVVVMMMMIRLERSSLLNKNSYDKEDADDVVDGGGSSCCYLNNRHQQSMRYNYIDDIGDNNQKGTVQGKTPNRPRSLSFTSSKRQNGYVCCFCVVCDNFGYL